MISVVKKNPVLDALTSAKGYFDSAINRIDRDTLLAPQRHVDGLMDSRDQAIEAARGIDLAISAHTSKQTDEGVQCLEDLAHDFEFQVKVRVIQAGVGRFKTYEIDLETKTVEVAFDTDSLVPLQHTMRFVDSATGYEFDLAFEVTAFDFKLHTATYSVSVAEPVFA